MKTLSQIQQEAERDIEKQMGDGTLFRTQLNYNNMAVQYVKVAELKSFLRTHITRAVETALEEVSHEKFEHKDNPNHSKDEIYCCLDCYDDGQKNKVLTLLSAKKKQFLTK